MAHAPFRKYYGYRWQTVIRPRILRRAGGVFNNYPVEVFPGEGIYLAHGPYVGFARCERCGIPDRLVSIWAGSELDIAHLTGDVASEEDSELAALCRICHRAHDYRVWSLQFASYLHRKRVAAEAEHQRLIDVADAERPILQMLEAS